MCVVIQYAKIYRGRTFIMLYGRDTTSNMGCWHGKGWYTIVMGDDHEDWTNAGAAWYDEKHDLDDDVTVARMASNSDYVAGVRAWYHGNGVLPDDVVDHEKDVLNLRRYCLS
jgi:hypothetical protein